MAKTIAQGFTALQKNLNITSLQATTVSTRQKNVREAVEKEMEVIDSFLAGSYRRNTMIAPLADADVDVIERIPDDAPPPPGAHRASPVEDLRRRLLETRWRRLDHQIIWTLLPGGVVKSSTGRRGTWSAVSERTMIIDFGTHHTVCFTENLSKATVYRRGEMYTLVEAGRPDAH